MGIKTNTPRVVNLTQTELNNIYFQAITCIDYSSEDLKTLISVLTNQEKIKLKDYFIMTYKPLLDDKSKQVDLNNKIYFIADMLVKACNLSNNELQKG